MGVMIGINLESIQKLRDEERLFYQVKQNLIVELEIDKELLTELNSGIHDGSFIQLQTTSWDMFKEKFSFDELDLYFQIGQL